MIVFDAERFGLRLVHRFIVEREIRDRNKQQAALV